MTLVVQRVDDTPGWDSFIKRTGALVICFEKNPYQDPVLWGCEDILVPILKQHIIWLNTLKEGCTGVGPLAEFTNGKNKGSRL